MFKRIITALAIILGVVLTLYRLEVKRQQYKPIKDLEKKFEVVEEGKNE